jgi:hypothetical protein
VPRLLATLWQYLDPRVPAHRRALALATAHGFALACLYVLKPVRNAVFLDQLGVGRLPLALVAAALAGVLTTAAYARLTAALRGPRLCAVTFVALLVPLLLLRVALPAGGPALLYVFYVLVNLIGLVSNALVWLVAGAAFDPRDARRLLSTVASGGTAGAMIGGFATGRLAATFALADLLLIAAGLLAVAFAILAAVRTGEPPPAPLRAAPRDDLLAAATRPGLLRSLGITAACAAVVSAVVDVQFNAAVADAFPTPQGKAAFFGVFFAWLNAGTFLVQVVATPILLRTLGVGVARLVLPASLVAGALGLALVPGLAAAGALKAADQGLRHSVHRSATEVLFLPFPAHLRRRARVLVDGTVDAIASGLGALAVLALTDLAGASGAWLASLSVAVLVPWLLVTAGDRRAYVDAFRRALERRTLDPGEVRRDLTDASTVRALGAALASEHPRRLVYALDMLAAAGARPPDDAVRPLLVHGDAEVRRRAVRALGAGAGAATLEACLADPDTGVRGEAIHALCGSPSAQRTERLRATLTHADASRRAAALSCLADHGTAPERALLTPTVTQAFACDEGPGAETGRALLARALGACEDVALRPCLRALLDDASPRVVAEALAAAGHTGDAWFAPGIVARLGDRRHRRDARAALVALGPAALPILQAGAADPAIVRTLGDMPLQGAADALLATLARDDAPRHAAVEALWRLRVRHAALRFDEASVRAALDRALADAAATRALCHALAGAPPDDRPAALLARALDERAARELGHALRLLGLLHRPRDLDAALRGLSSGRPAARAQAVELLDNVLDRDVKQRVLPLVDGPDVRQGAVAADREAALDRLVRGDDVWLRACARAVLARAGRDNQPVDAMSGIVEKVMALRAVDVFSEVPTEPLVRLAAIAEEASFAAGAPIYREGEASEAMYLVLDGRVELRAGGAGVHVAGAGEAFGTWALFDDEPRVTAATAAAETNVLRIGKDDFVDLLADDVEVTRGVLKAIVRRLRAVLARAG